MTNSLLNQLETIITGTLANWRGTKRGAAYVSLANPPLTRWVMEGRVWRVQDLTTTAALNNALPTTVAGLTIQNPSGSGKTYVVLGVSCIADTFAAALQTYSLNHTVHAAAVVPYTRDVALTEIGGMKAGQGAYSGQAILDRGATVVNDNWSPIGKTQKTILASQTWDSGYIPLDVPVVIPQGLHYSVGAAGDTVDAQVGIGLVWAEVEPDSLE